MAESAVRRLRARINRGDSWLTYDLGRLLSKDGLDDDAIEELETRLLTADAGVEATRFLVERLRIRVKQGRIPDAAALSAELETAVREWLEPCARPLTVADGVRPFVILVVGVNGAGKTTTLGKIAWRMRNEGRSVLIAAGDTFRAASTDQLKAWAERAGAPLIAQPPGADPAAVIFDAMHAARARGADVLIADTAGRLHTQGHLMEELRKVRRVMQKVDPAAPHETLLVVDGTTGQNALRQAAEFHEALGLTGVAITKLDGTARGGVVLALARAFGLPVRFIGVGEKVEDLIPFDAASFAAALIGRE